MRRLSVRDGPEEQPTTSSRDDARTMRSGAGMLRSHVRQQVGAARARHREPRCRRRICVRRVRPTVRPASANATPCRHPRRATVDRRTTSTTVEGSRSDRSPLRVPRVRLHHRPQEQPRASSSSPHWTTPDNSGQPLGFLRRQPLSAADYQRHRRQPAHCIHSYQPQRSRRVTKWLLLPYLSQYFVLSPQIASFFAIDVVVLSSSVYVQPSAAEIRRRDVEFP